MACSSREELDRIISDGEKVTLDQVLKDDRHQLEEDFMICQILKIKGANKTQVKNFRSL